MTYSDLNLAITELLQGLYPKRTILSNMRVEGLMRPSFYFYMKPVVSESGNLNTRHNVMGVYIDYLQDVKDEKDIYDTLQTIRDAFGHNIIVGKKSVNVVDFDWDLNGADRNVAEMNITLEWYDNVAKPETAEIMRDVTLRTKYKED